MKSLVNVKKLFGITLGIAGELAFFFGLICHGSTVGLVCEFGGVAMVIASIFIVASEGQ